MSFTCIRGHVSLSDDYCDVCGAKNRNVLQRFASGWQPETAGQLCPTCGTAREGDDRYCPSCAYDFETGERFEPATAPSSSTRPAQPRLAGLVLALTVAPSRSTELGCPPPPEDVGERVFMLDLPSMLIGRDEGSGLQVAIGGDPYVSRHHAEIVELDDGWGVRDLGSTNGTKLNGIALVGAEVRRLQPGDVIDLGCFSRLTVRLSRTRSDE